MMKQYEQDIIKWRRDLHQIPELGLEVPKTVAYISSVLDELGIDYKYLLDGNAIVALIEGEHDGKTIALRADIDGLPVTEATGLPFSSTNGNMHACGHDGHAAMLLGAAKYLMANRDKIKGRVKLLFQPAEESPGGAKPMLDDGAFKDPVPDAVFGLHEGNISKNIPTGNIGIKYGPMMAATDRLDITVRGKGAHGAYPHLGVDPIVTASEIILSLQSIVSREIDPGDTAVISITVFKGGTANNIIPEKVTLWGTVRTFSKETRDYVRRRIQEVCDGIAMARGAKVDVIHEYKYPALINDKEFVDLVVEAAKKHFPDNISIMENVTMGGDDMAFFIEQAQGAYIFLSNPKAVDGEYHPHHHPKFDVDESQFYKGATLLAQVALDFLNK